MMITIKLNTDMLNEECGVIATIDATFSIEEHANAYDCLEVFAKALATEGYAYSSVTRCMREYVEYNSDGTDESSN